MLHCPVLILAMLDTAAPDRLDALRQFAGRCHAFASHFPVALLCVAVVIELWRGVRRDGVPSRAAISLVLTAAATSLLTAALGWLNASSVRPDARTLALESHRWLGVAVSVLALATCIAAYFAVRHGGRRAVGTYRTLLALSAVAVVALSLQGDTLVHGGTHYTQPLSDLLRRTE